MVPDRLLPPSNHPGAVVTITSLVKVSSRSFKTHLSAVSVDIVRGSVPEKPAGLDGPYCPLMSKAVNPVSTLMPAGRLPLK